MATPIPANEAPFTVAEIVAATGAASPPSTAPTTRFQGVFTDSRACRPGCVYVALVGEKVDGHRFVAAAVKNGARALVVAQDLPAEALAEAADVAVFRVADTLLALGGLAAAHRARLGLPVVAITGSAGKTTTKELAAALLRLRGATTATQGNLNNRIGLPMTIFTATAATRFLVLEAGMSIPGEMMHLAQIAAPDVAVVVNVGYAHTEGVGGIEGVAREKGALYEGVKRGGTLIVNADDARASAQVSRAPQAGRQRRFGRGAADVRLVARAIDFQGARLTIARDDQEFSCRSALPGEAQAVDFVAALAAAEALANTVYSAEECEAALADAATHLVGRATLREGAAERLLLDDTYNANPESMEAGIALLAELAASGRRAVAILGEMRELGAHAEEAHDRIGRALVAAKIDLVISCGGLADRIVDVAEAAGIPGYRCRDSHDTANFAPSVLRDRDAVLVKASRSVATEVVVERLLAPSKGEA
jgi:UDP-N-acetylmuramoyl-tripeptide--D-alanyl-D-alanine ligase